ncbi:hypothetical protein VHEMI02798 [[Torrubiella] hemipterigena]|uniref:BTB domain-containing protein n=1 Tax=[Torrubiella] hemipterigena TaxID=1531966 RepID=A0A0A1T9A8_9HYPO|nr:hypothetical protein VHEMI02798 [[Torrubiella] hemipterigena]
MWRIPYSSIVSSRPFKFLVGPDKIEYTIHGALVAHQSRALHTLVYGGLKESQEQCVEWAEVDPDTFIRFAQYLYTGDYAAAATEWLVQSAQATIEESPEQTSDNQQLSNQATAPEEPRPHRHPESPFIWRSNHDPAESLGPLFLSHAKLYVLADCYGIEGLTQISLYKLHNQLRIFTLHPERITDVLDLVEFSYEHGPAELQDLVSSFASSHLDMLWKTEEFKELFGRFPDLAMSLMDIQMNKLLSWHRWRFPTWVRQSD